MGDPWGKSGDTDMIELSGKIMAVAIILLFFALVFLFCLHLYAKWFWYRRREQNTTAPTTRRRRLDFSAGHQEIMVVPCSRVGLDPRVLKSIPVIIFHANELKDGLECAVCLCEVSQGEKARILPKCNHGFHVECIDMWFHSHSTCPLCRSPVSNQKPSNPAAESTLEDVVDAPLGENASVEIYPTAAAPSFPTNVLFWGDETQVSASGPCVEEDHLASPVSGPSSSSSMASTSSSPDGMLAIDVPRTTDEDEDEDEKSPVPTRLGSLKRLLTGSTEARNLDLEHGRRRS